MGFDGGRQGKWSMVSPRRVDFDGSVVSGWESGAGRQEPVVISSILDPPSSIFYSPSFILELARGMAFDGRTDAAEIEPTADDALYADGCDCGGCTEQISQTE
jgi:hypothetical protein